MKGLLPTSDDDFFFFFDDDNLKLGMFLCSALCYSYLATWQICLSVEDKDSLLILVPPRAYLHRAGPQLDLFNGNC